jgi:anti-sigma B factor antagonist
VKVSSYQAGGAWVLCPREAITQAECDELRNMADESSASGGGTLMIDLTEVPFIDSAGLEMFLELSRNFREQGGRLKLAGLNEICEEIFRLTDLTERFEIYPSVEKAAK